MNPLQPADAIPFTDAQRDALIFESVRNGLTHEQAKKEIENVQQQEIWKNELYTVCIERAETYVHLSIRRNDRAACRDWRHFQAIKNQLCGPEWEGLELYPAESRKVDAANQFHLWCVDQQIPVGFKKKLVSSNSNPTAGYKQRP